MPAKAPVHGIIPATFPSAALQRLDLGMEMLGTRVALRNQILKVVDQAGLHPGQQGNATGGALLAGIQAGLINDLEDLVPERNTGAQHFRPQIDPLQRSRWKRRWDDAVNRSLGWHG